MFVASRRPPRPVSSTAYSTCFRAKITMPIAKTYSKNVGWGSPSSTMANAACPACSAAQTKSCLLHGFPSSANRSSKCIRWGEVKSPVFFPAARSALSRKAQTLPFPLLPATWMTLNCSCGFPKRLKNSLVWLSEFLLVNLGISKIFPTVFS